MNDAEFRETLAGKLATIEGKIDVLSSEMKLILPLVQTHERQIAKWQGANAVLLFLASVFLTAYLHVKHWLW